MMFVIIILMTKTCAQFCVQTLLPTLQTDINGRKYTEYKLLKKTQCPHVFFFTLFVMLGTMNLLALLP